MPLAWTFFLGFQTDRRPRPLPIQLEAKVGEYLDLVMKLIFAFGLCFQLPVLLALLVRVGPVCSSEGLASKRRYAIVARFIMAAVLTPPDVISQIALAVPIFLLYEISIIAARLVERSRGNARRPRREAGGDDFQGPAPMSAVRP